MRSFDFLVIGSGIGGLSFALKVAEFGSVGVICKAKANQTNTCYAQGGISAVTDPKDSFEVHIADTLLAGAGLCNEKMVRLLAEKAPLCIEELQALGVNFTRNSAGNLDLGREGGHSQNRIVHTHDYTGFSIQEALLKAVKEHQHITLLEDHFAIDLLLSETPEGKKVCVGVKTFSAEKDTVFPIYAKAIMLATGGAGQVFQHTTNPDVATGDGIAMAFRAGASIKDLEFFQFHPTALYDPEKPTFLISEAVRGFGAELVNADGVAFMHKYHPSGSLAPRDVVSRAIQQEIQQTDFPCVYLDFRHLPAEEVKTRFPKIYTRCLESKLDMTTDLIPVVPAAHYMCGGVVTDEFGRSSIRNLYACGETACTGIHGANRLASNSLPEAWIFASRAAEHAVFNCRTIPLPTTKSDFSDIKIQRSFICPEKEIWEIKKEIQRLMWEFAGIVRTVSGLRISRKKLKEILVKITHLQQLFTFSVSLQELQNLVQVSLLIINAALKRKKSAGCHFLEQESFALPQLSDATF